VDRVTTRLAATWDLAQGASVLSGAEASVLRAFLQDGPLSGQQTGFKGGRQDVQYGNVAAFAELNVENFLGSLVAGVRAEHHSGFGTSVVPRVTWTKVLDPFHFKLLFSRAFRAPSVENIELSQDIKSELATSLEAEMGVRVGDHAFLSLNVFDNIIRRPIIYGTVGADEYYLNRERAGSRGVEADFKLQGAWGGVDLNYAYYNALGRNQVDDYAVPGHPSVTLAFPAHKFNLNTHFHLAPGVTLTPSATLWSERWADVSRDADENPVVARIRPMLLLNVFLWARDVGVRGLNVGLGMHNILDEPDVTIQPYHGGHAPLPAAGREVVFRLSYGVEP
jgi:outer membrane receptor protein involved in Fe transport